MGDPKVLTDFLRWGAKKYPAKNYMVVIGNHGAGWDDTDIYRSVRKTLKRNFTYKGTSITRGGGRDPPCRIAMCVPWRGVECVERSSRQPFAQA